MSDTVLIALIAGLPSIISATLSIFNNILGRKNTQHIVQAKEAIITLEKNTNSIKDALVKVTGEAEHAKGVIEGESRK